MISKSHQTRLYAFLAAVLFLLTASGCHSSKGVVASRSASHGKRPQVEQRINIDPKNLADPAVALLKEADSWLGVPYKYGGETRSGIDCSALVLNVFRTSLAIKMPRNSRKQADFCKTIKLKHVEVGDLLFFSTPRSSEIGHVGIYVGEGRMVHASSSRGVIVSAISDEYFQRHFLKAGRVEAYYALLDRSSKRQKQPEPAVAPIEPDPQLLADIKSQPKSSAAETAVPMDEPSVAEPVAVAVAAPASPAPVPTVPAVATRTVPLAVAVKGGATTGDPSAISSEEARRRVLEAFKEQPADSVLTPYFD